MSRFGPPNPPRTPQNAKEFLKERGLGSRSFREYDQQNTELFQEVLRKRQAQAEIHKAATFLRRRVEEASSSAASPRRRLKASERALVDEFADWISVLASIEDMACDLPVLPFVAPETVKRADTLADTLAAEFEAIPPPKARIVHKSACLCGDDACCDAERDDRPLALAYSTEEPAVGVTRYSCHLDTSADGCAIS